MSDCQIIYRHTLHQYHSPASVDFEKLGFIETGLLCASKFQVDSYLLGKK